MPQVRPLSDLDLEGIAAIDEKIGGRYRPDIWERRLTYYLRRDPECSVGVEIDGKLVGFMLGEVRSGEFGLDEPTGWIEVMGVDPERRGAGLGRALAEAVLANFRERGARAVRTMVDRERGELDAFFSALGFAPAPLKALVKPL